MSKRVMFVGPSGIGKTTMAMWAASQFNIPFISGSVSNLIPHTKNLSHENMLNRDKEDLQREDWQIMQLRNKLFKDKEEFITDRSYVDLAAYYWYKQDRTLPECEMTHFMEYCKVLMTDQCDLAIFMPLTLENRNGWMIEDNGKRITKDYFQVHMSILMSDLLANWEVPTVVVQSLDMRDRQEQISYYLKTLK